MRNLDEVPTTGETSPEDLKVFEFLAETPEAIKYHHLVRNFDKEMIPRHFDQANVLFKRFGKLNYSKLISTNLLEINRDR